MPALATADGPLALNATLDLADAAGNGYGDPRSTFPYRMRGMAAGVDTYAALFDPANPAFYAGQVRLLRFVISNPSPDPVAVRVGFVQAPSGSWKVTETWARQSWVDQPTQFPRNGPSTSTSRSIDGFAFFQSLYWATPYGSPGSSLAKTGSPRISAADVASGLRRTEWATP